jgi:hypothetical protein
MKHKVQYCIHQEIAISSDPEPDESIPQSVLLLCSIMLIVTVYL